MVTLFPFAQYIGPDNFFLSYGGLLSGFATVGIPLVALLFFLLRRIYPYKLKAHMPGKAWFAWGTALVFFVASIVCTGMQFQDSSSSRSQEDYVVDADLIELEMTPHQSSFINLGDIQIKDRQLYGHNVYVSFVPGTEKHVSIHRTSSAQGVNKENAAQNALFPDHEIKLVDNKFVIPAYYKLQRGEKFRGQDLHYEILVPIGKNIKVNRHLAGHADMKKDKSKDFPYGISNIVWISTKDGFIAQEWIKENNFERTIEDLKFEKLNIEGQFNTRIEFGHDYEVKIMGKESIANSVELVESGGTLSILSQEDIDDDIKLKITTPILDYLFMKNTGDMKIEGFNVENMKIIKESRSDLRFYSNAKTLDLRLLSRGDVVLIGTGNLLNLHMDNRASIDAERYVAKTAELSGDNHSESSINVTETLYYPEDFDMDFHIYGDPMMKAREDSSQENN